MDKLAAHAVTQRRPGGPSPGPGSHRDGVSESEPRRLGAGILMIMSQDKLEYRARDYSAQAASETGRSQAAGCQAR